MNEINRADIRPDIEYQEVNNMIREYTRIRLQAFNFTLIFNGALLASFVKLTDTSRQQLFISLLATLTTFILLLIEIRTISIADEYVKYARTLEDHLRFSMHNTVEEKLKSNGIRTRIYFIIIYSIFIIMWTFISLSFFV
ncbi:MAG: hypothetical protein AAGA80_13400 [Cyanobacteria bacterium P01_F01_bin.143]